MERYYNSDGLNVYLVLKNTTYADSYETKMIQKNKISGMLEMNLMSVDGELIPCYTVSGLKEFGMLYSGKLAPLVVRNMLQALFELLDRLQGYLLSVNNVILQSDFIYMDEQSEHFFFVYLPGYQVSVRIQLQALLEEILGYVSHEDKNKVGMIYDIYQKVSEENLNIAELKECLPENILDQMPFDSNLAKAEAGEEAADAKEKLLTELFETETSLQDDRDRYRKHRMLKWLLAGLMVVTVTFFILYASYQYKRDGTISQIKPLAGACMLLAAELFVYMECLNEVESKEDAIQEQSGEDVLQQKTSLQEETIPYKEFPSETIRAETSKKSYKLCVLLPMKIRAEPERQKKRMVLFAMESKTIGREETTDFYLDSKSVSRIHARTIYTGDACVLEDLNSTNGTFVNGYRLQPGCPMMLLPGDEIAFGNEVFEYWEYEAVNNENEANKQGENIC